MSNNAEHYRNVHVYGIKSGSTNRGHPAPPTLGYPCQSQFSPLHFLRTSEALDQPRCINPKLLGKCAQLDLGWSNLHRVSSNCTKSKYMFDRRMKCGIQFIHVWVIHSYFEISSQKSKNTEIPPKMWKHLIIMITLIITIIVQIKRQFLPGAQGWRASFRNSSKTSIVSYCLI